MASIAAGRPFHRGVRSFDLSATMPVEKRWRWMGWALVVRVMEVGVNIDFGGLTISNYLNLVL